MRAGRVVRDRITIQSREGRIKMLAGSGTKRPMMQAGTSSATQPGRRPRELLRIGRRDWLCGLAGVFMQTSNATDTLVLDQIASVEGGALHVRYALINRAGRAIVAFDGATGTGGGPFPDLTGQCYVSCADGAVRVQRIRPSPHPSIDTTRIFMPAVSQIAPQETRRVQFRLPLPVKERSEYTPDYPGAMYEQQLVNRLELRIGYFFKTGETVLKP